MPYPADLSSRFPAAIGDEYADYNSLAGLFTRVDHHAKGDAPNAVTEQEMIGIVAMYQNIDRGRGDLTIDTSEIADPKKAAAIHAGMMDNVAKLLQTATGREMLAELSSNEHRVDGKPVHRHTSLRAYHEDADGDGRNDDWGAPISDGNSEVVAPKGQENDTIYHFDYDQKVAGRGADATVLFTPGGKFPDGFRSDVVLAHELSHALHDTAGTNDSMPVQKSDGVFSDFMCHIVRAEHQAAGLGLYAHDPLTENAYRDERRAMGEAVEHRDAYDDNLQCNSTL